MTSFAFDPYFDALFDPGEALCFAWRAQDAAVLPLDRRGDQRSPFVSLNPLYMGRDADPGSSTLPWARPDLGRRADVNVSVLRNILIEMDAVPLQQQFPVVRDCGMPFTTSVFSGGKSIHFVVSLSDPAKDRAEYDELVDLVHRAVPAQIDSACRNPSRLTRNPGVMRGDKEQRLIEVRTRVPKAELRTWAGLHGVFPHPPVPKRERPAVPPTVLPRWVLTFLTEGVPVGIGERNKTAFRAACALASLGWTEEDISVALASVPNLVKSSAEAAELRRTIRSAYRRARA